MEGAYRNNIEQVARFLTHICEGLRCYVCEERIYDPRHLGGSSHPDCVAHYPFDDHNAPCLELLGLICQDMKRRLMARTAALSRCTARLARQTGVVISCFLLYHGVCSDPDEALGFFAEQRTTTPRV